LLRCVTDSFVGFKRPPRHRRMWRLQRQPSSSVPREARSDLIRNALAASVEADYDESRQWKSRGCCRPDLPPIPCQSSVATPLGRGLGL